MPWARIKYRVTSIDKCTASTGKVKAVKKRGREWEKKSWLNKRTLPTSHGDWRHCWRKPTSPPSPPSHPFALWFSPKAGWWVVELGIHVHLPTRLRACVYVCVYVPSSRTSTSDPNPEIPASLFFLCCCALPEQKKREPAGAKLIGSWEPSCCLPVVLTAQHIFSFSLTFWRHCCRFLSHTIRLLRSVCVLVTWSCCPPPFDKKTKQFSACRRFVYVNLCLISFRVCACDCVCYIDWSLSVNWRECEWGHGPAD